MTLWQDIGVVAGRQALFSDWPEQLLALGWKQLFDVGLDICRGLGFLSVNEMTDDRLPSIDKLDGSNWSHWKVQLTNFLKAHKLWKLCLGMETLPPQATAQQAEDYEVKVARVMSILCQTVSTQYLYLVTLQTVTTPKEAWDALVG